MLGGFARLSDQRMYRGEMKRRGAKQLEHGTVGWGGVVVGGEEGEGVVVI